MHGNQTVDWSRIDSERVSGWSRFRNGKKKTADSRYRQTWQKTIAAYSNMHLHNNTIIGAHFNRTIFRIYWVHLVLFLHAIFFLLPVTSSSSDHVSNETPARTN